jgi:CheY-like chemotaxis protein
MDVQMPELDGYSATRIIRSGKLYEYPTEGNKEISLWRNPRNPKPAPKLPDGPSPSSEWLSGVPIVAMTASAIRGDREKCRDAGMDDYLAKPVKCTTLEKMLLKWCPGKHALRSNSYPISAPSSAPFAGSGDLSLTGSKKSPFTMAAIAHATGMDSNAPSGPGSMAVTEKGIVPNPDIKRVVVEPPSLSTVVSVNSTPKASDRHGRPVEDPFDSMYASDENSMHGINISVLKRQLQEEVMNSAAGGNGRERENLKEISHGKTTRGRTTESMPQIMHAASAPM